MNAAVIARQLVDTVRYLSPATNIKVEPDPIPHTGLLLVEISVSDALKVIDFIESTKTPVAVNPAQGTLFDQDQ